MKASVKRNTIFIKVIFFLLVVALIAQLFRIQVLENSRWSLRSELRNKFLKTFHASRGNIYFSDDSPLAVNELDYNIFALPQEFNREDIIEAKITKEQFSADIATILPVVDKDFILHNISIPGALDVPVANAITEEKMLDIMEKYPVNLNIWRFEEQPKRIYPNGSLASKIVGFVGKDENGNEVGRYGVEEYFDGVLKGSEGIFEGKKDDRNNIIVNEEFDSISSKDGMDITLTIDKGTQLMLEQKLTYWMDKLKSKEATAVIMEPNTGRIIAIANVPTYDPNKYFDGELVDCSLQYYSVLNEKCNKPKTSDQCSITSDQCITATPTPTLIQDEYERKLKEIEAEKKKLAQQEQEIRSIQRNDGKKDEVVDPNALTAEEKQRLAPFNNAVKEIFRKKSLDLNDVFRDDANSFIYEPGSVIKVITVAIAYNYNTIPKDPSYQLGGHKGYEQVQDAKLYTASKQAVSSLTVQDMLKNSDNVGALRVALTVKRDDFVDALSRFGLGKTTGVELADESVFNMKEKSQWSKVDQATGAFGQGSVSLTPIQLTNMWNILASEGKSFKPTVVRKIDDNGKIKDLEPVFIEQVISADAAKAALSVNALATQNTSKKAKEFYAKYPFTGKTGTANIPKPDGLGYIDNIVNTSYLGSVPLENPKFTMLVWFREPRIGVDNLPPNSINTSQYAWLDIANSLVVKMNIAPKN
jgi:cell division protein FtsI/penicillin-binding protein 2